VVSHLEYFLLGICVSLCPSYILNVKLVSFHKPWRTRRMHKLLKGALSSTL
jgi:hypothetical protein